MFCNKKIFNKIRNKIKKIIKKYKSKLQKEKNSFICILNHDIKTPILAHIQSLELLLKGSFGTINPTQKMVFQEMLNSHYFILQIITNSIFLLKYENENYKLNLEKINLLDELNNCIIAIKEQVKEKKQNLIIKAPRNLTLNADKKIIQKIIYNILQNSVVSGLEESNIEINIKENKKAISFSAKNKTIYMTKEKLNSLFNEDKNSLCDFNQLGISLNLNIAKKLITAHNWNIIAQSKKDNSSEFGFVICK